MPSSMPSEAFRVFRLATRHETLDPISEFSPRVLHELWIEYGVSGKHLRRAICRVWRGLLAEALEAKGPTCQSSGFFKKAEIVPFSPVTTDPYIQRHHIFENLA